MLRGDDLIPAAQAPLLCALGMSVLCADLDTEPSYERVLHELQQQLLPLFPNLGLGLTTEPIANRTTWHHNLIFDVLTAAEKASEGSGYSR